MGRFLRENWLWIAVPAVVLIVLLVVLLRQDEGAPTPFVYPVF